GRDFDARDRVGSQIVAIVNEAFARKFSNGVSPVGQHFWVETTPGDLETRYEIVGLVRNTKYGDLREEFRPIAYYADAQNEGGGAGAQVLIRSRLSQSETIASVNQV